MVSNTLVIVAGVVVGLCVQWLVLRMVDQPQLLAHPNQRSSHLAPTPTMGGLMIVIIVLAYLLVAGDWPLRVLSASLAAIAVVGLIDDVRDLPSWLRLGIHLATSAVALYALHLGLSWPLLAVARS